MAWLETLTRRAVPAQPRRPPRALLAWEFGGGRTHVANILGVTRHLRLAGFECLATLYETGAGPEFAALGTAVVQNYVWPSWRRDHGHAVEPPREASLSDRLAQLGFADPKALRSALAHYEGLFRLFEPDIVLATMAYGAVLAARDRLPAIAFGFNATLPPVRDGGFLPYEPEEAVTGRSSLDALCHGINRGLTATGRRPVPSVAGILAEAAIMPFGPFDPYEGRRFPPCLPLHVYGRPEIPAPPDGEEVFVYLQGFAQHLAPILPAVLSLRRPVRAYWPDLLPPARAALSREGVTIEDSLLPLPELLTRARCVLHHGGQVLTAACLAAGIPQVILPRQVDNRICGRFVRERGLGAECWIWDATTSWIVDAVRGACADEALRRRCRAAAPEFRTWFTEDPTARVAEQAQAMLGSPDARVPPGSHPW